MDAPTGLHSLVALLSKRQQAILEVIGDPEVDDEWSIRARARVGEDLGEIRRDVFCLARTFAHFQGDDIGKALNALRAVEGLVVGKESMPDFGTPNKPRDVDAAANPRGRPPEPDSSVLEPPDGPNVSEPKAEPPVEPAPSPVPQPLPKAKRKRQTRSVAGSRLRYSTRNEKLMALAHAARKLHMQPGAQSTLARVAYGLLCSAGTKVGYNPGGANSFYVFVSNLTQKQKQTLGL